MAPRERIDGHDRAAGSSGLPVCYSKSSATDDVTLIRPDDPRQRATLLDRFSDCVFPSQGTRRLGDRFRRIVGGAEQQYATTATAAALQWRPAPADKRPAAAAAIPGTERSAETAQQSDTRRGHLLRNR